jgi:UDP-N-acetylmuramyl tripeptide synthase
MKRAGARIIILLGAEGGGRDKAKRPIMGELAAKMADDVIISNVDPYEDDPKQILEDIAVSSEKFGKIRDQNLFVIEDRRLGIRKALSLAEANDIVLITGKGAEQSIVISGKRLSWDDRQVVREELRSLPPIHENSSERTI